jgi:hypothetical protein
MADTVRPLSFRDFRKELEFTSMDKVNVFTIYLLHLYPNKHVVGHPVYLCICYYCFTPVCIYYLSSQSNPNKHRVPCCRILLWA